ncbi:MAG: four helix bundle suffix domain-containing protein [Bacteroidales bacterium]|nr:four helix bundle suffix domain-containing protein [Bacteroidales bacterium]
MAPKFGTSTSYMTSQVWLWATIVQYFTEDLAPRIIDQKFDVKSRLLEQMVMAARSGTANIAEGLSRHQTSRETEIKLLDVAKASLAELSNDIFFRMLRMRIPVWDRSNPNYSIAQQIQIANPQYGDCWLHDSQQFLLECIDNLQGWFKHADVEVAANTMLIICERLKLMIQSLSNQIYEEFLREGGFREQMSTDRIEAKKNPPTMPQAPRCPSCGAPMIKRLCQAGKNHGKPFWGCTNYPQCKQPPIFDPALQK